MAATWAVAWFSAGVGTAVLLSGAALVLEQVLLMGLVFGGAGFAGGILFSTVLGLAERHRKFEELSLPRFAAWGAMGALLTWAAFWTGPWAMDSLIVLGVVFTGLGAASSAGSLLIARHAGPAIPDRGMEAEALLEGEAGRIRSDRTVT